MKILLILLALYFPFGATIATITPRIQTTEIPHKVTINKVTLTQKGYIQFLRYITEIPTIYDFTFCIWLRSENLTHSHPLLSYSVDNKRMIRAWISPFGKSINLEIREIPIFRVPVALRENHWYHVCESWDSKNAFWTLYLNGKVKATGLEPKAQGIKILPGGDLTVGQEYTDFDKGLDDGIEGDIFGFNLILAPATPGYKHSNPNTIPLSLDLADRRVLQVSGSGGSGPSGANYYPHVKYNVPVSYNPSGYNPVRFNPSGYHLGHNLLGYNPSGYKSAYNPSGQIPSGHNPPGYKSNYNPSGHNPSGYNPSGHNPPGHKNQPQNPSNHNNFPTVFLKNHNYPKQNPQTLNLNNNFPNFPNFNEDLKNDDSLNFNPSQIPKNARVPHRDVYTLSEYLADNSESLPAEDYPELPASGLKNAQEAEIESWSKPGVGAGSGLGNGAGNHFGSEIKNHFGGEIKNHFGSENKNHFGSEIGNQFSNETGDDFESEIGNEAAIEILKEPPNEANQEEKIKRTGTQEIPSVLGYFNMGTNRNPKSLIENFLRNMFNIFSGPKTQASKQPINRKVINTPQSHSEYVLRESYPHHYGSHLSTRRISSVRGGHSKDLGGVKENVNNGQKGKILNNPGHFNSQYPLYNQFSLNNPFSSQSILNSQSLHNSHLNSHSSLNDLDGVGVPNKPLGLVLVEVGYGNCAFGRGAPVDDPRVLISWTKTPVRVFGGAVLKSVLPFCV